MNTPKKSSEPFTQRTHLNLLKLIEALLQQEKNWLNAIPRLQAIILLALTQGLASFNLAALGTVAPALESSPKPANTLYLLLIRMTLFVNAGDDGIYHPWPALLALLVRNQFYDRPD